jgi:uncharacterized protein YqgC (DUF456 family)
VLVALVAVAMAVGLVGTIVPVLPGLALIGAAAVVYGVVEGFGVGGTIATAVIVALAIGGTVAGFVLPQRAAAGAGASRSSLLLGAVGGVAGAFAVPVVGVAFGGVVGIYLGERLRTGDHAVAWRATVATVKGFGIGALVQLGAGVAMVLTWITWVVLA